MVRKVKSLKTEFQPPGLPEREIFHSREIPFDDPRPDDCIPPRVPEAAIRLEPVSSRVEETLRILLAARQRSRLPCRIRPVELVPGIGLVETVVHVQRKSRLQRND